MWLSLLWSCFSLISLAAQPAAAELIDHPQTHEERVALSSFKAVSTQAKDLLLPSSSNSLLTDITLPTYQLAQKELNLANFCQNYPYNSQCSEVTPSNIPDSQERSLTPIPVPPPAPPTPTQDVVSQQKSGWAIVPEASSLGFGGSIVRQITPNFNARAGVNAFGLGINIEETDFDYEGDLNLFNVSSLIDVHPTKNSGFRISGGLIFGSNNIDGTADVSEQVADGLGEIEVDGQTIDVRQLNIDGLATIDTDIEISNGVSPYLGIGGGNAVREGKAIGFWWNLGVVFAGSPKAEVTSNISTELPESLREEVETETNRILRDEEQNLEDALDFLKVYPVLSLGLSYQF
ncbi:MAG: hypothetical protein ACFCU7_15005 [Pleurocapsa sp.]